MSEGVPQDNQYSGGSQAEEGVEQLCSADASALDALFDPDPSPIADSNDPRAVRLRALLGLIDQVELDEGERRTRVDATLAFIRRVGRSAGVSHELTLSPDDDEAVEALVAAGFDLDRVARPLRPRAMQALSVLTLLETPVDGSRRENLIRGTVDRVQESIDAQEDRLVVSGRRSIVGRVRWADVGAVAALLLISVSVVWPMLASASNHLDRVRCQSNMQAAGLGFGLYSADHRDSWALATDSQAGTPWWYVGDPYRSNSANLFTIARTQYATLDNLACPGNENATRGRPQSGSHDWGSHSSVSFSYQNMFAVQRPRLADSNLVLILSDKSPVVISSINHRSINPYSNSPNHDGTGQNLLFSDGSVVWSSSPVLEGGENIWLPRVIERLIEQLQHPTEAGPLLGTESPDASDDAMMIP